MAKGKSFLSDFEKTSKGEYKKHLRIVITDADVELNQVVVSVTTLRNRNIQDCSCVLHEGDHSFIKHDSIVDYKRTKVMSSIEIFNGISRGIFISKEDVKPEILEKIISAAKKSVFIPQEIKRVFTC